MMPPLPILRRWQPVNAVDRSKYKEPSHDMSHHLGMGRGLGGSCRPVVCTVPAFVPSPLPVVSWVTCEEGEKVANVAHLGADSRPGHPLFASGRVYTREFRAALQPSVVLTSAYLHMRAASQPLPVPIGAGMWKCRPDKVESVALPQGGPCPYKERLVCPN